MAMATLVPRYTAEEIRHFPDDRLRYEVIRGELFVTPAPGTPHQRAVGELYRLLQEYLERYQLGEAIVSPFEVEFAEDTAVQPDVIVILNDRADRLAPERFYGAPTLALEVISYSSKRTDRLQKRLLYQEEAVPEYWIVDAELRRVERCTPGAAEPELLTERLVWAPVAAIPPLTLDLPALFAKIYRSPGGTKA